MRQQENALQFVVHYQRKMARIRGEMERCFLYWNSVYLPVKECVEHWERQAKEETAVLEEEFLDVASDTYPFIREARTRFDRTISLLHDRVEALLTKS